MPGGPHSNSSSGIQVPTSAASPSHWQSSSSDTHFVKWNIRKWRRPIFPTGRCSARDRCPASHSSRADHRCRSCSRPRSRSFVDLTPKGDFPYCFAPAKPDQHCAAAASANRVPAATAASPSDPVRPAPRYRYQGHLHPLRPEENEELRQDEPLLENVPIRKNYRIVFIKAPSQNLKYTAAALKRAQSSNEEKTVIYVLSKKPDLTEIQQQLQVTQSEAKVQKPEVYFIKYKTQEEAQRAQQEIQAQYDALGGATHISDEGVAPIASVSSGSLTWAALCPSTPKLAKPSSTLRRQPLSSHRVSPLFSCSLLTRGSRGSSSRAPLCRSPPPHSLPRRHQGSMCRQRLFKKL